MVSSFSLPRVSWVVFESEEVKHGRWEAMAILFVTRWLFEALEVQGVLVIEEVLRGL